MSKHNPATAFITIARIIRERGTRGEVIIHPLTGSALRISSGSDLQVRTKTNERKTLKVCTVRDDRGSLLVTFHGISTREDASALRQATIEIDGNELPELPEHEYYHHQIVGLTVVTAGGDELGKIAEIMETGGADVYIVRGRGKEYLIPAIRDVIAGIDLSSGIMTVRPLQGLLD